MPFTAFQYSGLPPAAYPLAIKTMGEFEPKMKRRQGLPGGKARAEMKRRQGLPGVRARKEAYGLTPVGSRRDLSRLRPLTEPAPPPFKRHGSSVNVNPEQPKPTNYNSVLSVAPTVAAGEIHKLEPVQGKRWAGIAVVALLAFAFFRK